MFARFEVRRLNLPAARKILGTAIGVSPKEALFKGYIQLEFDVRNPSPILYDKVVLIGASSLAPRIRPRSYTIRKVYRGTLPHSRLLQPH